MKANLALKKWRILGVAAVAVASLSMVGCGGSGGPSQATPTVSPSARSTGQPTAHSSVWPPDLVYTQWELVSAQGAPQAVLPEPLVTLYFDPSGELVIEGMCGPVTVGSTGVANGQLVLKDITKGASACAEPARNAQDDWILALLNSSPSYETRRDGDFLWLTGAGMKAVLEPVK